MVLARPSIAPEPPGELLDGADVLVDAFKAQPYFSKRHDRALRLGKRHFGDPLHLGQAKKPLCPEFDLRGVTLASSLGIQSPAKVRQVTRQRLGFMVPVRFGLDVDQSLTTKRGLVLQVVRDPLRYALVSRAGLDRPPRRHGAVLASVQLGQLCEPDILAPGVPLNQVRVPKTVHVGIAVEQPDLRIVPPRGRCCRRRARVVGDRRPGGRATVAPRAFARRVGSFKITRNSRILSTTNPCLAPGSENRASYRASASVTST